MTDMAKATSHTLGGYFADIPKPWRFRCYPQGTERRHIEIKSVVWPSTNFGNGHHHVTIREENNSIYDSHGGYPDGHATWREPWIVDYGKPDYDVYATLIKGRTAHNGDSIRQADVRTWAEGTLAQWGVTSEHYTIEWDLDDDDPNANVILAREMRKRMERGD